MTIPGEPKVEESPKPQRLPLVFGGELESLESRKLRGLSKIDIAGLCPDCASGGRAGRAKAQETVDHAETRRFVLRQHRRIAPDPVPQTTTA